jgi:hypothetical protein
MSDHFSSALYMLKSLNVTITLHLFTRVSKFRTILAISASVFLLTLIFQRSVLNTGVQ